MSKYTSEEVLEDIGDYHWNIKSLMPLEETVESLKFQFSSAMKFKNKKHHW